MNCPVCESSNCKSFNQDKIREYLLCPACDLVFVPRSALIPESLEKERYEEHENSDDDQGYITYLSQIASSIKNEISEDNRGLDFGCGKTMLLARLMNPNKVNSFDIFFHPDFKLLQEKYDFIILSEVIEHLRDPRKTMTDLCRNLNPGGKLFIKTKFRPGSVEKFSNWFYKRDITHIQFFNDSSLNKVGEVCKVGPFQKVGEDLYMFKR